MGLCDSADQCFFCQALNISFREVLACEPKTVCRTFVENNELTPEHLISDVAEITDGSHHCLLHNTGSCVHKAICEVRPDVFLAGPPCQPWSSQRCGRYSHQSR